MCTCLGKRTISNHTGDWTSVGFGRLGGGDTFEFNLCEKAKSDWGERKVWNKPSQMLPVSSLQVRSGVWAESSSSSAQVLSTWAGERSVPKGFLFHCLAHSLSLLKLTEMFCLFEILISPMFLRLLPSPEGERKHGLLDHDWGWSWRSRKHCLLDVWAWMWPLVFGCNLNHKAGRSALPFLEGKKKQNNKATPYIKIAHLSAGCAGEQLYLLHQRLCSPHWVFFFQMAD